MSRPRTSLGKSAGCKDGLAQPFPFTMAFQPIVNVESERVYAYEALVRGVNNESALSVLSQVTEENRYAFDQGCRVTAITLARRLGLEETDARLSINFMPSAIEDPEACLQLTLESAASAGLKPDRLIFEITETEEVQDRQQMLAVFREYRKRGFQIAMDDFGAGFCGLNLFVDLTPDILKLDMELTRRLHQRPVAAATMSCLVELCERLQIPLIAEGVETVEEYRALRECGIRLMQGYLLARPGFETLPEFSLPEREELSQERSGLALQGRIHPAA